MRSAIVGSSATTTTAAAAAAVVAADEPVAADVAASGEPSKKLAAKRRAADSVGNHDDALAANNDANEDDIEIIEARRRSHAHTRSRRSCFARQQGVGPVLARVLRDAGRQIVADVACECRLNSFFLFLQDFGSFARLAGASVGEEAAARAAATRR